MRLVPVALLALQAAGAVLASDWPQWRGPARDGTGFAQPRAAWPASLRPAWSVPVGSGHSSPVVAGARVFLFSRQGDDEVLEAFDRATGGRAWRQSYAAPYRMNMAAYSHGKGPKSTPAVAGARVFTFGISGILSAHDAASGRVLWRKEFSGHFDETSPDYGAAQSPLVDGGHVIVHVGGSGGSALTAFDAATGAVVWSWDGDGPGYASPVAAVIGGVRQVVTFTEAMLVGLSADTGRLLWKLPFSTSYDQNAVTPVVSGDVVFYSGLDHPLSAARIVRTGAAWHARPVWENAEVALYMSTPVLAQGRLFGLSHRRKGQLFAVDAASGRTIWLGEGRQGDNAALAVAGGAVLALTTEGQLLVLAPAAPTYNVLRTYSVSDKATWAHPAVVDDGVIVKDDDTLTFLKF